jgi:hypothetical protein
MVANTVNVMNRREIMVDLLSKVLDRSMSAEEALAAWPNIDDPADDRLMRNAWHALYDYGTDEDIRAREPAYELSRLTVLRSFRDEMAAQSK